MSVCSVSFEHSFIDDRNDTKSSSFDIGIIHLQVAHRRVRGRKCYNVNVNKQEFDTKKMISNQTKIDKNCRKKNSQKNSSLPNRITLPSASFELQRKAKPKTVAISKEKREKIKIKIKVQS